MKSTAAPLAILFLLVQSLAYAAPHYLDISGAANTPIEDDGIAGNGKGGWSDEGINLKKAVGIYVESRSSIWLPSDAGCGGRILL